MTPTQLNARLFQPPSTRDPWWVQLAAGVPETDTLARLGLSPLHVELVIADVCRQILAAGPGITYGGGPRLGSVGDVLLRQAQLDAAVPAGGRREIADPDRRRKRAKLYVTEAILTWTGAVGRANAANVAKVCTIEPTTKSRELAATPTESLSWFSQDDDPADPARQHSLWRERRDRTVLALEITALRCAMAGEPNCLATVVIGGQLTG